MEILKHVGSLVNTGKRVAVIFLQIPGKETHTLVIDTDALPERFHDALMKVIEMPEAQQAQNLGEVLARRLMPDTGRNMLEEFHINGMLEATPVTNVYLMPRPNQRVLLSDVLKAMGKDIENIIVTQPKVAEEVAVVETSEVEKGNVSSRESFYQDNRKIDSIEENIGVARNLLAQADMLFQEAEAMRSKAFSMAPSLKPKSVVEQPKLETKKEAVSKPVTKTTSKKTTTPKKTSKAS